MKFNENARQQNVLINLDFYSRADREKLFMDLENPTMLEIETITNGKLSKDSGTYQYKYMRNNEEKVHQLFDDFDSKFDTLRIFLLKDDKLEVAMTDYGFYTTVLIRGNKKYYVNL